MTESIPVSGFVKPGFEAVHKAFIENFEILHELGAAALRLAMYQSIGETNQVQSEEE